MMRVQYDYSRARAHPSALGAFARSSASAYLRSVASIGRCKVSVMVASRGSDGGEIGRASSWTTTSSTSTTLARRVRVARTVAACSGRRGPTRRAAAPGATCQPGTRLRCERRRSGCRRRSSGPRAPAPAGGQLGRSGRSGSRFRSGTSVALIHPGPNQRNTLLQTSMANRRRDGHDFATFGAIDTGFKGVQ